jgi:hypothetical protein
MHIDGRVTNKIGEIEESRHAVKPLETVNGTGRALMLRGIYTLRYALQVTALALTLFGASRAFAGPFPCGV